MLRRWFIAGLAVIVPIVLTGYVIYGLFQFADGILGKYINRYVYLYLGYRIPGLGIFFSLVIILLVGFLASIAGFRLFRWMEDIFLKLPLIGKIYVPIKKIFNFLFSPQTSGFRKVALIEYPREGIYCLGFVTNKSSGVIDKKSGRKMVNVFIPSSPSPLTGFVVMVPEEDISFLDMTIKEATGIIVSGGMVTPGK